MEVTGVPDWMWEQGTAVGEDGVFILYSSYGVEEVRGGLLESMCLRLLNTCDWT